MARPSPFVLLLRNWKRSIFIVPTFSLALGYTYDYTVTTSVMRVSCKKASHYGDQKLKNPTAPTRHITVILNPKACKGKSKKLYEKWVEPMLHLAGIKVSLVETTSPIEAFDLMKIMSNCDGVAIVGGDGTVHEAINGLLSREDRVKATKDFPVAIIPAGQNNSIARYIHQGYVNYRNHKEFLIGATVQLIDATTTKFDTLEITPCDADLKKTESPKYAVRDLRYGLYQDNFFKSSGYYYYQTYVKPLYQRLQRLVSSKYSPPQIESILFSDPCIGCSRCYERHKLRDPPGSTPSASNTGEISHNRKWWSIMAPVNRGGNGPSEQEKLELELSKRDNPDCGAWLEINKLEEVTDFRACMMGDKKIRLSLGRQREYNPSDITETQDIRLKLKPELDVMTSASQPEENKFNDSTKLSQSQSEDEDGEPKKEAVDVAVPTDETKPEDDKAVKFLIDGQPMIARSVEITALSEAITVFTGPHKVLMDGPDTVSRNSRGR